MQALAKGLTVEDMAASCYNAFDEAKKALGIPSLPWAELDPEELAAWFLMARSVMHFIFEHDEKPIDVPPFAKEIRDLFIAELPDAPRTKAIGCSDLLPWQVVIRHAGNFIYCEWDRSELPGHEASWADWVRRKRLSE